MIYNDRQWEIIKEAAPHFETAKHEYISNAPRYLTEQIINTFELATGKKLNHTNLSCAICVLHIYQQIGKTYFEDLANHQTKSIDDCLQTSKQKNTKK